MDPRFAPGISRRICNINLSHCDINNCVECENSHSAKSCALLENLTFSPEDRQALKTINSIWSELPPEIKIGVMKMIEAATVADETLGPC